MSAETVSGTAAAVDSKSSPAASSAPAAADVNSNICGACAQPFDAAAREPRLLWCGHTVCLACATAAEREKQQIACPFDGDVTPLNSAAASVLPSNKPKLALVGASGGAAAAAPAEEAKPAEKCSLCEKTPPNPATVWCPKCGHETLFCASCYDENHQMAAKLKALHKATPLSERSGGAGGAGAGGDAKSDTSCAKHESKFTLYCVTDAVPICLSCKEEGEAHHKHDAVPIAKFVTELRETINKRTASTATIAGDMKDVARSAAGGITQSVASSKTALTEVEAEIESHIAAFRARRDALIAEVNKQRTSRLTAFEARGGDAATALSAAHTFAADAKVALAKTDLQLLRDGAKKQFDDAYARLEAAAALARGHPTTLPAIPVRFVSAERLMDDIKSFGAVGGPAAPTITDVKVSARLITLSWVAEGAVVKAAETKDFKHTLSFGAQPLASPAAASNFLSGLSLAPRPAASIGKITAPVVVKEVTLEIAAVDAKSGVAGPFTEIYRGTAPGYAAPVEPLTTYHFRTRASDAISGFGEYSPIKIVTTGKAGGFLAAESKIITTPELNAKLNSFYGIEDEWKLLYRGTRDGFTAKAFHKNCDVKGETMTIVVSTAGCIFGGYTPLSWSSNADYRYDKSKKSFLFSLKNNSNAGQFKVMNSGPHCDEKHTIYCHSSCGPTFGSSCDLSITDNFNTSQTSYSDLGHSYDLPKGFSYGTPTTKSLLGGTERFKVVEIEVFGKNVV